MALTPVLALPHGTCSQRSPEQGEAPGRGARNYTSRHEPRSERPGREGRRGRAAPLLQHPRGRRGRGPASQPLPRG